MPMMPTTATHTPSFRLRRLFRKRWTMDCLLITIRSGVGFFYPGSSVKPLDSVEGEKPCRNLLLHEIARGGKTLCLAEMIMHCDRR